MEVVPRIRQNDAAGSIAVIGRYNYLFVASRGALVNDGLHANADFWTFHKSKGLEADYCVLIGFFQGKSGFPNENKDEGIIEALLPSLGFVSAFRREASVVRRADTCQEQSVCHRQF